MWLLRYCVLTGKRNLADLCWALTGSVADVDLLIFEEPVSIHKASLDLSLAKNKVQQQSA